MLMIYKNDWMRRELPFLMIFLLTVFVFYANGSVTGPMIQADESSHLLNAAAIAGYYNDFASSYHAGYSLLISPAFLFANGPEQAWFLVRIINAALYFIGVLFLLLLAQRVYVGKSRIMPLAVALLAAVYPMWVIMAGYTFAQIGFFAVYVVLVYLVLRAVEGSTLFWLFSGLMAGFLYWVHPTGLAVAIALCLSAIYASVVQKKPIILIISLTSVLLMVLSYKFLFVPWLHDRMTISGVSPAFHYPAITNVIKTLLNRNGLIEFVSRMAGHVFYLTIGTVGLVWAYFLSRADKHKQAVIAVPNTLIIFLCLSLAGVMSLSVLLFSSAPDATRLDHWMYGRYVEAVIAPLILVGAMTVTPKTQVGSIVVAMFSSLVLMAGITEYSHTARMNVSAFWQDFYIRDAGLAVWCLSGIGLILVSLIVRRFSWLAALAFIATVYIWMSSLQIDWHERAANNANRRSDLARFVRLHYPVGSCVGFDHSGINSYNRHVYWFDYGFVLYDYALQRISLSEWMDHCDGPLFSYDDALDERVDVHRIGRSATGGPTLWAKEPLPLVAGYPYIVRERSLDLVRVLDDGWYSLEFEHVWSTGNSVLKLPVPEACVKGNSCKAVVSFSVFGASPDRRVMVTFAAQHSDDSALINVAVSDSDLHSVEVPLISDSGIQMVTVSVPQATSPRVLRGSVDDRVLGIALRKIELSQLESR